MIREVYVVSNRGAPVMLLNLRGLKLQLHQQHFNTANRDLWVLYAD